MSNLYADIARRTGGDIYIGVVGPVRTGKSTLIKRIMEELVIPNIEDLYQRERARDELPQSGSGRTIMTAEPKFVPEEAVEITPDGTARLSVRLIDSVGYLVNGAIGATENGQPRMVTTPWADTELSMEEAAELGTRKVMEEHSTVGLVVTTDGSITDIPRADYREAEARAIRDMQATGKPFLVVVNSAAPNGGQAQALRRELEETYGVHAVTADCQSLHEAELGELLRALLYTFPMREVRVFLPAWVRALELEHPLKAALYSALRENAAGIACLADAEPALRRACELEQVCGCRIADVDLGSGTVTCELEFREGLFYQILSERTGFSVENDGQLLRLLTELAAMKREYDKISAVLDEVRATGYGIVMPDPSELHLDKPEIVRKGSSYAVHLKASAPSIHLMRANIETELSPIVGDEQQSDELIKYLLGEYEGDTEKLWQSNIFGKSLYDLVTEGLNTKIQRMPEDARQKLTRTLARMINENTGGMICILL